MKNRKIISAIASISRYVLAWIMGHPAFQVIQKNPSCMAHGSWLKQCRVDIIADCRRFLEIFWSYAAVSGQ